MNGQKEKEEEGCQSKRAVREEEGKITAGSNGEEGRKRTRRRPYGDGGVVGDLAAKGEKRKEKGET
jgi:hypothetical protein